MRRTILFLFVTDTAALFVNPFADLLRQAPISLAKRNFALPRHPDLVTLNADPPVYEVPGFMQNLCDGLERWQQEEAPAVELRAKQSEGQTEGHLRRNTVGEECRINYTSNE